MDFLGADGTTSALHRHVLVAVLIVVVDVPAEGAARVASVTAYDLSDGDEQAAFRALAENETARTDRRAQFTTWMESIAVQSKESTARKFAVSDPVVETTRRNETGLVVASPDNLVVMEDGRLIVGEDSKFHDNCMVWVYNP